MALLPYEVLPGICNGLEAGPALAAAAASQSWRDAALCHGDAWRQRFAEYWHTRQKPGFARAWWRELLRGGVVQPAPFALTSPLSAKAEEECDDEEADVDEEALQEPDEPASPAPWTEENWHQRFLMAAKDRQRAAITKAELCFDVPFDRQREEAGPEGGSSPSAAPFRRAWVLAAGACYADDFLGDELKFNADGSVNPRSCLFGLVPDPTTAWEWHLAGGGRRVILTATIEGGHHMRGQEDVVVVMVVERAMDGGFRLRCQSSGLVLCSREKTEEEHLYRSYSILRFPPALEAQMEELVSGQRPTPFGFPPSLTAFERLVVHRLAESVGLQHDSRGVGVQRRIVVWRTGDEVPPQHYEPVDGGSAGHGAAASRAVAEAALAWRAAAATAAEQP